MKPLIMKRMTAGVLAAVMAVTMLPGSFSEAKTIQTDRLGAMYAGLSGLEKGNGLRRLGEGDQVGTTESKGETATTESKAEAGTTESGGKTATTESKGSTEETTESGEQAPVFEKLVAEKEKTVYFAGETISWNDLKVTAQYTDKSTQEVAAATEKDPEGYVLSGVAGIDMDKAGTYEVNVIYQEQTALISIVVRENVVEELKVTKENTEYFTGDEISWDDLKVTAIYTDEKEVAVSKAEEDKPDGYVLEGLDKLDTSKEGSYEVKVSYGKKSAVVMIRIAKPAELTGIAVEKTKVDYTQDDKVTWEDLVITATFSNGVTKKYSVKDQTAGVDLTRDADYRALWKELYDVEIGDTDLSSQGEKVVLVTLTVKTEGQKGQPVTKEAGIKLRVQNVMTKLKVSKTKKTYTVNDPLNLDDLKVTVYYNNNTKRKKVLAVTDYSTNASAIKLAPAGKKKLTVTYSEKDLFTGEPRTLTETITLTVKVPEVPVVNGVRTADVKAFGAEPNDLLTDKAAIQDALDVEATAEVPLIVYVPAGTYYIGNNLYIHSNTTLRLAEGAVIVRNSQLKAGDGREGVNHNMIRVASSGTTTNTIGGYDNGKNIVIEGGTWDGGNVAKATGTSNVINIGHAENVVIRNTTIKNCYGSHLIEFAGVKHAEVYGCSFSDFRRETNGVESEAIQLDVCNSDWNQAYLPDGTACEDINIHDNTFKNYPVAVGNHHLMEGHHNKNIVVTGNQISCDKKDGYQGIFIYGCDDTVVTGNTISGFENGMKAYGCENFVMQKNTISDCSFGIVSAGYSTGKLVENEISDTSYQGIFVYDGSKLSAVSDNILNDVGIGNGTPRDGIAVCGSGCTVTNITGNTIDHTNRHGIYVYSGAGATKITGNVIANVTGTGVYVYEAASKVKVKSNEIDRAGTTAIKVASTAKVSQKYTFAPVVKSLKLKAGTMKIKASYIRKVELRFKNKVYTKSTKKKNYTMTFKKYKKKVKTAEVSFTDKYKNVVIREVTVK